MHTFVGDLLMKQSLYVCLPPPPPSEFNNIKVQVAVYTERKKKHRSQVNYTNDVMRDLARQKILHVQYKNKRENQNTKWNEMVCLCTSLLTFFRVEDMV